MHTRYRVVPMESISQLLVNDSWHLADYRRYRGPLHNCSPPYVPLCHPSPCNYDSEPGKAFVRMFTPHLIWVLSTFFIKVWGTKKGPPPSRPFLAKGQKAILWDQPKQDWERRTWHCFAQEKHILLRRKTAKTVWIAPCSNSIIRQWLYT